jgi:FkbM family methyltransferase
VSLPLLGFFGRFLRVDDEFRRRVEMTVSCRDADRLARVTDAGRIVDGAQIMHNGVRVVARGYYGAWMAEIIERLQGVHEPQEELAFHVMIEHLAQDTDAPVVVEVGAFWAYYSLWALQRMPRGRALLVEPDPGYLEVGRINFALNGRTGEFVQATVGTDDAPPAPFDCESDGITRDVPIVGLRSLVQRHGHIDLLLVDVQGAELAFLEGGRDLLQSGRVRQLLVSTHHHSISGDPMTHQRVLALLLGSGAHVIAEHSVAESFSGDGLVAASFDPRDRGLTAPISYGRVGHTLFPDPLHELAAQTDRADNLEAEVVWRRGVCEELERRLNQ